MADADFEAIEALIEKLVAGGEGLFRHEGKVYFVPGVLPGERVLVTRRASKASYGRAELLEILEPSPRRREPPCPQARSCGGCDWLHLEYGFQLESKQRLVQEMLSRAAAVPPVEVQVVSGRELGYRSRARFHADGKGGWGFMGRKTNAVHGLRHCPVLVDSINSLLASGMRGRSPLQVTAAGEKAYTPGSPGPASALVAGKGIRFSPGGFFQSNESLLGRLVELAIQNAQGRNALDLYCGVGLFGAFLQDHFDHVVGVESNAQALDCVRHNWDMERASIYACGVEEWFKTFYGGDTIDFILVDPPRSGLSKPSLTGILRARPKEISYVSCNPVTQSRDLTFLCQAGYELSDFHLVDLYPQTSHMETVARLRRG